MIRQSAGAHGTGRRDELQLLELEELGAGEPGDACPAGDADDRHQVTVGDIIEHGDERKNQHERRNAHHQLD